MPEQPPTLVLEFGMGVDVHGPGQHTVSARYPVS
jgi:hypothetical protein